MQSSAFKLSWLDIKNALLLGGVTAVIGGLAYVIGVGNIFGIDFHSLANIVAMAFFTTIFSTLKSLFTTSDGTLAGFSVKE